jgi:hypothetical protein
MIEVVEVIGYSNIVWPAGIVVTAMSELFP